MIATVLFLTQKLLNFVKEHFVQSESGQLTVALIEASLNTNNSTTDSMVIFSNCEHLKLSAYNGTGIRLKSDTNNNDCKFNPLTWQRRKVLHARRKENQTPGLTAIKKMEGESEASRGTGAGMGAVSPRKTPISPRGIVISPESDCNSNNLTMKDEFSTYDIEKIQDYNDLFHDNSDYQWFLDYGYKDNTQQRSIFSILSSHDKLYYDDLARDLDANLAEVDMDDFHREDIQSVFSTLPNMCNSDIQGVEEREMFASMSESMMVKFGLDYCSPHSTSQEGNSNSASMCKSELLFSPVRESSVPNVNLSIDSLDLSENDINLLITCQANKNNYTIAFQGSTVLGPDDSLCHETGGSDPFEENRGMCGRQCSIDKHSGKHSNNSMARSDSVYTTWSKIKQRSSEHLQLKRQASGNNNPTLETASADNTLNKSSNAIKSLSLPNLFRKRERQMLGLSVSGKFTSELNSPVENEQYVKLYDIKKSSAFESCDHSMSSGGEDSQDKPHNLNLVKLFIKQKSVSHEGMCNYTSDRPLCSSYNEGNPVSRLICDSGKIRKDCACNLECNKSGNIRPLQNNWTQQNRIHMQECSLSGFEDSLVSRNIENCKGIQEKDSSDSESVEQMTESSKQILESVEQTTESCSTSENLQSNLTDESSHKNHQRANLKDVCPFNVNNNNSVLDNRKIKYCSDESTQENGSNTESTENITCNCRKNQLRRHRTNVMEKSIQTSKLLDASTSAKELKVPAYILYPNYSLPNLEFLKEKHYIRNIDFTKIFLRPQAHKEDKSADGTPKRRNKTPGRRPFSVNDIETLKKTGFKHVRDWDSLTFLLPKEYKQFLQDIPEIVSQLKDTKNVNDELKPLFCLSSSSKKTIKRPISCDSNFFMTDFRSSNFSSTATQPSSGYRGSSTMLASNASNPTPSPRNPSLGFRYDSNESVYNSRKNTPPRSGSLLNSDGSDDPCTRPPIPRSILRNNSLDNTKYTCKTQKENANKRYSLIEFTEKNFENNNNINVKSNNNNNNTKAGRRKSAQDPCYLKSPQKTVKEASELNITPECDGQYDNPNGEKRFDEEASLSFRSSTLEGDMRRLEELLEISAVFGESIESFTESDMLKLRSQVSKFLTMQKNLQKVSDCLQNVNDKKISSKIDDSFQEKRLGDIKHSQTPNNTPEHKKKTKLTRAEDYDTNVDSASYLKSSSEDWQLSDNYMISPKEEMSCRDSLKGLKKTVSFAEKICSLMKDKEPKKDLTPPNSPIATSLQTPHKLCQGKGFTLVDVPISEESFEGSPMDSPKRSAETNYFLLSKKDLIMDVKNAVEKIVRRSKVTDDKIQQEVANICLHHLCPSLYAVLSDGLKEEIDTPFGPIRNSVWSVVEATSQQGPLTETLNHLVQRLNRDDILAEGLVKFNAFIFGLLNVNSLNAWFSYLRTRDGILHKYYNNRSLLLLSNSAGAPVRVLMDELIQIIEPLSGIKFCLDLMYQAKLLHCSLQNLNCLLEATNNDLLSPTKHLMLLKLVQSIQNSINQPSDGRNRQSSEEIERLAKDLPILQAVEKCQPQARISGTNRPRPRSGCDILNTETVNDVASSVRKRWSGVQLNSKLLQAFERLGEETESEYTDSLDNVKANRGIQSPSLGSVSKKMQNSDETLDEVSHTWNETDSSDNKTKEQRKNILCNLNKKSTARLENSKADSENKGKVSNMSGGNKFPKGHKFKRLQQKWEKLSGNSSAGCSSGHSTPTGGISPAHRSRLPTPKSTTPEKSSGDLDITLPSPTSKISRIPRPVSSPIQTTPTSEKPIGISRKHALPVSSGSISNQKGSAKSNNINKTEVKSKVPTDNRISRVDEVAFSNSEVNGNRSRAIRPSSLPYKGVSTVPGRQKLPVRANSASLNRKTDKNITNVPRMVRTLSHRLPSDSGHLSFNEGEKLKVVLEVDETWLLCCRGTQKGLVPKSAVIPVPEHLRY